MGLMSYNRVSSTARRGSCNRGFKLKPRNLSVLRLRTRFMLLLRFFDRLRFSCGQALGLCKKAFGRRRKGTGIVRRNNSRKILVREEQVKGGVDCRYMRSFGHSNSFYSEAIADCLEFIKRSSISMDQNPIPHTQTQDYQER